MQFHGSKDLLVDIASRVEICDDPSSSRISAALELPGMKADDVRVILERDNLLAISGERVRKSPSDQSASVTYPVGEIKYGKFLRTLDVPSGTMVSSMIRGVYHVP